LYGPDKVWIWLETYPATWWHDTNATQHEIMKTVVQYSFGFGDNVNVHDNTTNTISGRVSICVYLYIGTIGWLRVHAIWKNNMYE
jgi:hypothetical protein